MAAQSNSEEHVYDSIDNYEANPTAVENQQIAPPSSESRVADTPFSDQLTCDGAVIKYSEESPTSTRQQEAKTKSNAAETPFNSDHSAHAVAIDYSISISISFLKCIMCLGTLGHHCPMQH